MEHSAAENGKGWRASAWILERLFPGDYSPRMKERNAYLNLEERLLDKEAHEALDERLRELHERQAEERAARAAAQAAEAAGSVGVSPASAMDGPLTTDFTDGTDSECTSGVSVPTGGVPPATEGDSRPGGGAPNSEAELEKCESAFEGDSRDSRNGGGPETIKEPGRPRPADPNRAAALSVARNVDSAHEHPQGSAASPSKSTGRGRPDSLDEAAPAGISFIYSESDSRNSRNSAVPVSAFTGVAAPGSATSRE
jgi:hypothetical protein